VRYWIKLAITGIPAEDASGAVEYMLEHLRARRHLSHVRCVWDPIQDRAEFESVLEADNARNAVDRAHFDLIAVTSGATSPADESGYRITTLDVRELVETRH
jgi:hypothetical protein